MSAINAAAFGSTPANSNNSPSKKGKPRAGSTVFCFPKAEMDHRVIHAPRCAQLNCKCWHQEAALRCLMNNLDPDVAERPDELIVYGGAGKAARNSASFDAIVRELRALQNNVVTLVQSGKPVAVFRTHEHAPR